jgi:hypothetical protein
MAPSLDDAYHEVLVRAFRIASATGEWARPVHLLAALVTAGGPFTEALTPPGGRPLFGHVDDSADRGGGSSYLLAQTQQAARSFASERRETPGPEHLFLAALDQAEPEAMASLRRAALDPGVVRSAALRILGAPADLPPIQMPALIPAGTMDRPALRVDELDPAAWDALSWRQEHLPLRRLRSRGRYGALCHLESRACSLIATRRGLDDDQRCSLSRHHLDRVEQLVAQTHPELVDTRTARSVSWGANIPVARMVTTPRRPWWRWRRRWLGFTIGWGTWFSNRRVGLRDRWFRLVTVLDYRGAPQP